MRTEEQIVHQLIEIYHGGQVTIDSQLSERLVRDFLRKHRATHLLKYYAQGQSIGGECFQTKTNFELVHDGKGDYVSQLPALVFLKGFGLMVLKNGFAIPITDQQSFILSKRNIINGHFPKGMLWGKNLKIFPGNSALCKADADSLKEQTVLEFSKEINSFDTDAKITVDIHAVFYDPDQADDYDWTRDPYPAPSEIIDGLTTSTLSRDLNLMIRQFSDTHVNMMDDKTPTNEGV